MKKMLLIPAMLGFILFAGCKKEEPMDMSKMTEQTHQQAQHTAADTQKTAESAAASATEQTTCPILGNPIDKNVFVEYKGKKVYFCCEACKVDFNKDPEKYVKDLPQFKQ